MNFTTPFHANFYRHLGLSPRQAHKFKTGITYAALTTSIGISSHLIYCAHATQGNAEKSVDLQTKHFNAFKNFITPASGKIKSE